MQNSLFFVGLAFLALGATAAEPAVRKLHLIQDDAQDYMVSKIYKLKFTQANDLEPFVMGMVMRYNVNSAVNALEGANGEQLLTVTCPVEMMPCVDDFVGKADRDVKIDGHVPGDVIRGTGITRAVYRPKYRSGQALVDVLVNSVIGEGPYASVYAWDENSNQIYWKDNSSNSEYVFQFLGFLDRPAPVITLDFKVYEVRESRLRDLGVEYLAWKNGPGLNLFQTAFDAFSVSSGGSAALTAISGPVGGFFFAPQFDASFIRLLGQSGNAEITNTASLTVSNSDTLYYEIFFNPELQNIVKSNNDQTSVTASVLDLPEGYSQIYLRVNQPVANIHYGTPQAGYPASEAFTVKAYTPGSVSQYSGTLFFGYDIRYANVVERNNLGSELVETGQFSSGALIELDKEVLLGVWNKAQEVEQVIGVPWLMNVPILKYLFSTTTTSREDTRVCLTVRASLQIAAPPEKQLAGKLFTLPKEETK